MKTKQNNTEPKYIIKMIKEYWKKLYKRNEKLKETKREEKERKWFESEEQEKYVRDISTNAKMEKIMESNKRRSI